MSLLGYVSRNQSDSPASLYDNFIGGRLLTYKRDEFPQDNLLRCISCGHRMCFLAQLYCPISGNSFHRTIYLFVCLRQHCQETGFNWTVLRSQSANVDSSIPKSTTSTCWSLSDDEIEAVVADVPQSGEKVAPVKNSGVTSIDTKDLSFCGPFLRAFIEVYDGTEPFDLADVDAQPDSTKATTNLSIWTKLYQLENEFIEEDDNTPEQSFSGLMQTYLASRQEHGCEIVRYSWAGVPIFNGMPPVQLEPCLRCPRCQAPRVFELQLFPSLNSALKLDTSMFHVDETCLPFDMCLEDEVDVDWLLKFTTVLLFSCSAGCWTDTDFWVQECVVIQTDSGKTCVRDADKHFVCV